MLGHAPSKLGGPLRCALRGPASGCRATSHAGKGDAIERSTPLAPKEPLMRKEPTSVRDAINQPFVWEPGELLDKFRRRNLGGVRCCYPSSRSHAYGDGSHAIRR